MHLTEQSNAVQNAVYSHEAALHQIRSRRFQGTALMLPTHVGYAHALLQPWSHRADRNQYGPIRPESTAESRRHCPTALLPQKDPLPLLPQKAPRSGIFGHIARRLRPRCRQTSFSINSSGALYPKVYASTNTEREEALRPLPLSANPTRPR